MKLIIDIDKDFYESITSDYWCGNYTIQQVVKSGVLFEKELEDIKAEIEGKINRNYGSMVEAGMRMALETIDKHISGKENE